MEKGSSPRDDVDPRWFRASGRTPNTRQALAGEKPVADRFDSIIVDEAQAFGESWWPALEACLKDRDTGGLFVFLEQAQCVFMRHAEIPLRPLHKNLRNTKRIALTLQPPGDLSAALDGCRRAGRMLKGG